MLSLLFPKVVVNFAIPVLMAASTLAQHLGMLNTFFRHIAQLALVIATVTDWLAQPTKLLHGMVKRPLGHDNICFLANNRRKSITVNGTNNRNV